MALLRLCVIGDGVVRCCGLYPQAKPDFSDLMLLERSGFPSGSTGHAAGGDHPLNGDRTVAARRGYPMNPLHDLQQGNFKVAAQHYVLE